MGEVVSQFPLGFDGWSEDNQRRYLEAIRIETSLDERAADLVVDEYLTAEETLALGALAEFYSDEAPATVIRRGLQSYLEAPEEDPYKQAGVVPFVEQHITTLGTTAYPGSAAIS